METRNNKSLRENEFCVALIGLTLNFCVLAIVLGMFWFMYSQLVESNFLQSFVLSIQTN